LNLAPALTQPNKKYVQDMCLTKFVVELKFKMAIN
jgi:hypothetical protein